MIKVRLANIDAAFWRAYSICENSYFTIFENKLNPSALKKPFTELTSFGKLTTLMDWDYGEEIEKRMRWLVRRHVSLLLLKHTDWSFSSFNSQRMINRKAGWKKPDVLTWSLFPRMIG